LGHLEKLVEFGYLEIKVAQKNKNRRWLLGTGCLILAGGSKKKWRIIKTQY
jgi:hypothetical protein